MHPFRCCSVIVVVIVVVVVIVAVGDDGGGGGGDSGDFGLFKFMLFICGRPYCAGSLS